MRFLGDPCGAVLGEGRSISVGMKLAKLGKLQASTGLTQQMLTYCLMMTIMMMANVDIYDPFKHTQIIK